MLRYSGAGLGGGPAATARGRRAFAITEQRDNTRLTNPNYTYAEAARLAGVSVAAVASWVKGAGNAPTGPPPDWLPGLRWPSEPFHFLNLVELVVAGRLRSAEGVTMKALTAAHRRARERFETEFPFAHANLVEAGRYAVQLLHSKSRPPRPAGESRRARSVGAAVVREPAAPAYGEDDDASIAALREIHGQLDFRGGLAYRWWPLGKAGLVSLDTAVRGGDPTVAYTRLGVSFVYLRYRNGESVEDLMCDFVLARAQVEAAILYGEGIYGAKRAP